MLIFSFSVGSHTERIKFDKDFWDKTIENLNLFWQEFVAPELLFKQILRARELEKDHLQITVQIPIVQSLQYQEMDCSQLTTDDMEIEIIVTR